MINDVEEVQKQHKGKENIEEEDKQSTRKWKKKEQVQKATRRFCQNHDMMSIVNFWAHIMNRDALPLDDRVSAHKKLISLNNNR
jgi:hypothetical protein